VLELGARHHADVAGAVVDPLGRDAGQRQDRARDRVVGAPGGLDLADRELLEQVDPAQGGMDRLGVLARGLEQQRAVDVEEQEQGAGD
jgi:hypothetical protein